MSLLSLVNNHLDRMKTAEDYDEAMQAYRLMQRAVRRWERNNSSDMICVDNDDTPRGECPSDSKGARR